MACDEWGPVVVAAGGWLVELRDGCQFVLVVFCGGEGPQVLVLVLCVGFAVAGK